MAKATHEEMMAYIAQCAESIIEDDLNECGDWTDEEHDDLTDRAMTWCYEQYAIARRANNE